jgi:hypothetical protein
MKNLLIFSVTTILIVICILPQGCEKDDEKSEKFKLLTAHTWNYDTISTICQDPEIKWFINMLDNESKGSTVMYNADGKFVSHFESGSWKFDNGETEIITFDSDDPSDILGHVRIDVLTVEVLEITDLGDVPPTDTCYVKSRLVK